MKREGLRKIRGNKSLKNVSNEIGISQDHLSKLELGTRNPSFKTAKKIAKYYNVNVGDLFPDLF